MKKIKQFLIWLGMALAQAIAANFVVLLFSFFWYVEVVTELKQFLLIVAFIYAGFVIGVYGVGILLLRLRRVADIKTRQRFFTTAGCALLPLLALWVLGWIIGPANQPVFQNLVMDTWQPYLAQLALGLAILGFYFPGWTQKQA